MTPEKMRLLLERRECPRSERKMLFVRRTHCRRRAEKVSVMEMSIGTSGIVHYNPREILEKLPEEYRGRDCAMIYSTFDFMDGTDSGGPVYYLADQIDTYDGKFWKVIRTKKWEGFGFTQTLAVREPESFRKTEKAP